ncbi:MAG TPA: AAA family ATPase [Longimicrobium sp.]|nr:AAA family ATPase [Longimicrobium sp.]
MNDGVRSPAATLHLLTGAWASGKSTLVPHLARLLPEVVVFDWDILLPGLSAAAGRDAHTDPSTWAGLGEMWAAVIHSVLAGGRDALLCGPARREDFERADLARNPVRCAYLDCADEVLAARLRARGVSAAEVADELAFAASLRQSPHAPVRMDGRTPEHVAGDVVSWVRAARSPEPGA